MGAAHGEQTGRAIGRRAFLRLAAGGATAAALAGGITAPTTTNAAGNRPNIIFVNTDDLDAASLFAMPKLKASMTDSGTTVANFFVTVSLCCPSRASFLRGQFAHNTQVLTNTPPNGGFGHVHDLGIEQSTIATWLQGAGYRTALMGKYLNGYPKTVPETYVPPGWSEWYGAVGSGGYRAFDYQLNENGKVVAYGTTPQDYITDVLAGKATDFIARSARGDAPFFLYLATFAPHGPATPAPRYANAFPDARAPRPPSYNEGDVSDKPQWVQRLPPLSDQAQARIDDAYRSRLRSLQAVDDLMERIVAALQTAGALDNTYVVFSSDNGFHLGQHREPSGKQAPYEENIRLPLIVRGPGVAAGKTVDALLGNVDLAPTFAEWGGAAAPDFVDGRSFAPLLRGDAPGAWRQAFLIEHFTAASGGASPNGPRKQARQQKPGAAKPKNRRARVMAAMPATGSNGPGIPEFHGMRARDYVYIEYATNERELYDLTRDPDQLQNIAAAADPALLARLSARLAALKGGAGVPLRAAEEQPLPALAR